MPSLLSGDREQGDVLPIEAFDFRQGDDNGRAAIDRIDDRDRLQVPVLAQQLVDQMPTQPKWSKGARHSSHLKACSNRSWLLGGGTSLCFQPFRHGKRVWIDWMMKAVLATVLTLLILLSQQAQARVLFEGFYKLEAQGVHAGYAIIRHSLDDRKDERTLAYYWMKQAGAVTTLTGVSTISTMDFKPIRYLAWEAYDGSVTYTRGFFRYANLRITRTVEKGNSSRIVASGNTSAPRDAVFSALISQIQAARSEYRQGQRAWFVGLSEETSTFDTGVFRIVGSNAAAGQVVYQVVCTFLNETFEFLTTRSGEILATRSNAMNQITYLVPSRQEAVGTFGLNNELVRQTFGDVPDGGAGNPLASSGRALNLKELIAKWPSGVVLERR